jgi:diadenosine tetraphosphatase ApaH/serine/threonine PP2A family protein phosphatase
MLTLAAVVDNKIFCVHGGLSPQITTIPEVYITNNNIIIITR